MKGSADDFIDVGVGPGVGSGSFWMNHVEN
jgi:hypothetical protein